MKIAVQNEIRAKAIDAITAYFLEKGEDVGRIASNAVNFPFCTDEGEECFIEITVKIPKDNGDDGYMKRTDYEIKLREVEEKRAKREEEKAKKIARDKANREAKRKAKEE